MTCFRHGRCDSRNTHKSCFNLSFACVCVWTLPVDFTLTYESQHHKQRHLMLEDRWELRLRHQIGALMQYKYVPINPVPLLSIFRYTTDGVFTVVLLPALRQVHSRSNTMVAVVDYAVNGALSSQHTMSHFSRRSPGERPRGNSSKKKAIPSSIPGHLEF
ncbi:uncharacterized protein LOC119159558 isoform X2 [Rhipicephalus microplus]|uniref:uncharacterized protein LOC119159558 isoform X2 n=1 Tax=Rhipicephalus microplus TaxID=6941 RepID=UPI003F6D2773